MAIIDLNLEYCSAIVSETENLLLYTHIPAAVATLFLSIFVYLKNRTNILSKILLGIGVSFSVWVVLNLIIWLKFDIPELVMAAWAPIEAIKTLVFFLCWYFVYVFIEKRDFSIIQKVFWLILFGVVFAFSVTSYNLTSYNLPECIANESEFFGTLTLRIQMLISALLIIYIFFKTIHKSAYVEDRKKYLTLGGGVITFVLSFLILGKISEATQNYSYEALGLFGMVIFTATMAYLIFKYSLFNIKIFATQLLVLTLIVLTASQLTYTSGYTTFLAIATTLFSIFFGYYLIKSVRREIKQRKKLEVLTHELERANEKLKGLDKLKTEFLSLASHQLRSPLTAIKGYASMLDEGSLGKLTPEQDTAAKRIYTSAQGLVSLVEDLLNISKIEQGGMKYEMMQTELKKTVLDLAGEMKIPAENKGLELRVNVPEQEAFVATVDPLKMKQVFLNLIDNSIKYTPSGYVEIGLKREGKHIVFFVRDTGVGITAETKEKLFQKFSRGEGGKLNTGGSGLGLYLAQEIAKAHKGEIKVDSEGQGKGTTFSVIIPVN